jgi:hypothetical protein
MKSVGRTFETRHQNYLIDFGQTYGKQKYRDVTYMIMIHGLVVGYLGVGTM